MKDIKNDILWRVYLIYLIILIFGLIVIGKVAYIQFAEGDDWIRKAEELRIRYDNIEASRGNIYASDGSLLATSVPIFEIRLDAITGAISDSYYFNRVDSLADCLSKLFRNKTKQQYKKELINARKNFNRYLLIKRNVTYDQLRKLRGFPIFRLGKNRGGLIAIRKHRREMPFKILASRTIGYSVNNYKVGLEGSFDDVLKGISGKRLMQKMTNNVWVPINNENEIEPNDGNDIITTIDVNIQDVAENALLKQLIIHGADHGCALLMEVETGEIKAIANLGLNSQGFYEERYNYAIGESSEPGSTFKLPVIIVALEDKKIDIDDKVNTGNGTVKYYDIVMKDNKEGGYGLLTMKEAFEVSSIVGISKLINEAYFNEPKKFINGLIRMGLDKPTGIEIQGEGIPYIKKPGDPSWYGTTIPFISNGYEISITPLQILSFYNAVANNGKLIKPMLVKEIRQNGIVIKTFESEILNPAICSKKTINKAKLLLEGVVKNGTAKNLNNTVYRIAGKTGTAQIAEGRTGYNKTNYKASFVGYFPADDPKYSCIVVINNPSNGIYYGSLVAGPVFREIADKVYATQLNFYNQTEDLEETEVLSPVISGYQQDIQNIYKSLQIPFIPADENSEWVIATKNSDTIRLKSKTFKDQIMPNLFGMTAKDAIYLVEEMGIKVRIKGKGLVKKQSIAAGARISKKDLVFLDLQI
ncbi:penicillin-binding protein [candidate division KSB1 bacterium]